MKRLHKELFREKSEKKPALATIPKDKLGYDQYTVPDTVAVEPTFVAFKHSHSHRSVVSRGIFTEEQ